MGTSSSKNLKNQCGHAEITHCSQGVQGCWGSRGSPGISCKLHHNSDVCSVTVLLIVLFSILGPSEGLFWDHH